MRKLLISADTGRLSNTYPEQPEPSKIGLSVIPDHDHGTGGNDVRAEWKELAKDKDQTSKAG